jgi:hypothetical protein
MTPKEKAEDLVKNMSFSKSSTYNWDNGDLVYIPQNQFAKECALIAVDEVLFSVNAITDKYVELGMRTFWQEVRQEIENL